MNWMENIFSSVFFKIFDNRFTQRCQFINFSHKGLIDFSLGYCFNALKRDEETKQRRDISSDYLSCSLTKTSFVSWNWRCLWNFSPTYKLSLIFTSPFSIHSIVCIWRFSNIKPVNYIISIHMNWNCSAPSAGPERKYYPNVFDTTEDEKESFQVQIVGAHQ